MRISIAALGLALGMLQVGCASNTSPIPISLAPIDSYQVEVASLRVKDYNTAGDDEHPAYNVYHDGWASFAETGYSPTFGEALSFRLEQSLIPTGSGDAVELILLRTDVAVRQ